MGVISKVLYKGMIRYAKTLELKFNKDTLDALETNKSILFNIIKENCQTKFGQAHNFESIDSIDKYRKNVPLTNYEYYEKYIVSVAKGNKNILTSENVEYFGHTSGTTGSQKLLPITKTGRSIASRYNAMLSQRFVYECFKDKWTYGKGVMLTDMLKGDKSEGGIPITSASSGGMSKIKAIVPFVWTSPVEVMELEDKESAFYLHVLFALKEKELMYISGLFISSVLDFFRFIEANNESLVNDIKTGTINVDIKLNKEIRSILNRKLGKSLRRARELEVEFSKGFEGIAKRIWPNIIYIASVAGANFTNYSKTVDFYTDNLPICSTSYGATEGFIGINPYADKIEYVVAPDSCFFEFIESEHIDKENPNTKLINELKLENEYEVVVTSYNGLYRYRLGDVIRVVGFYNQSPKIEFLYRKNQLLNMVAEKTTENHIKSAIEVIINKYDLKLIDYTTFADDSITPGRYIIYLEVKDFNSKYSILDIEKNLDIELQKANLAYGRLRKCNRLGCLKVKFMKNGTFHKLKKTLLDNGASSNQLKVPRVLKDKKILESV